jgi:DNA-binding PucR family transcriptional regulator
VVAGGAQDLAAWIHQYVVDAARDENVDAFVARVDSAILADIPELAEDPVLVADLHASTRAQYQVFLSLLERQKQELLLPPQATDLALSIARRQLDLSVLLKVYRVALAAVWEYFTEVADEVPADGPDRADVLIYLWDHGGTWINEAVENLIGVFSAERETTMQGALARRTETVHALLRGDQMPTDEASRVLGHPLRALQTAVVLWVEGTPGASALGPLTEVAHSVGAALDAGLLTVPAGSGELWCWLATSTAPEVKALVAALACSAHAGEVRAAVGTTAAGLAGFRDSHREAVDAQRYGASVAARRPLTSYVDVELPCLVAGHEAGARALIRRELGSLAGAGAGLDRVRETVATYLSSGGNVEHTAEALHVHKNTVRYRLSQAEELIGHPLAERRTELGVALACLERYPVVPSSK